MKKYTLTDKWQATDNTLVDEALLQEANNEATAPERRRELFAQIREAMQVEVTQEEKSELDELYASVKPELKDSDSYKIISLKASRGEGERKWAGILNCRVNGDHVQVRF